LISTTLGKKHENLIDYHKQIRYNKNTSMICTGFPQ